MRKRTHGGFFVKTGAAAPTRFPKPARIGIRSSACIAARTPRGYTVSEEQQEMRQLFVRMTPPELVEYALLLLEDTARLRRELDDARGMIR